MDLEQFIDKIPFVYHLTDIQNIKNIFKQKRLISTVNIFDVAGFSINDERLFKRRKEHLVLESNLKYNIRDQRPLTKALNNCLIDDCTAEEFIYLLNKRVFFWPNLRRLEIHYGRYKNETPKILKFDTASIVELNKKRIELSRINSGATRCSGTLGGRAAARGKSTFVKIKNYDLTYRSIAEVTVLNFCNLPKIFYISDNPNGKWDLIKL